MKAAKPSITDAYCEEILPYLNKYAALYKVDSPLRVAHFLAQVGHENGFKVTSEDLNYTAIGMRKQFGCRNNAKGYEASTDECKVLPRLRPKLWSEPETYAHNPVKLGSYVYADRNDNGNEASGEGYKYRGRGVIQLTGKYNYRQYTKIHNQADPSDPQDFVANPDLIMESIKYGVESAFVWWSMFKINQAIDDSLALRTMSDIDGHVSDISIKVNGGTTGLQERINLFKLLKDMVAEEMGL
ncbi:glycoside hydrolase family 19 protein [Pseudomonas monsensis]|uniref:glycoside hydrolase family 19 protein n=1 Tax=Pseudomonas monsensis TaxID=2745509 RepID=UPI003D1D39A2